MGEVYRTIDTRLDRIVAIKTLPAHVADDPARRERFDREARAISTGGGVGPTWRPDGLEPVYSTTLSGGTVAAHAGGRFVALQSGEVKATQELLLTRNWLGEVKAKVKVPVKAGRRE